MKFIERTVFRDAWLQQSSSQCCHARGDNDKQLQAALQSKSVILPQGLLRRYLCLETYGDAANLIRSVMIPGAGRSCQFEPSPGNRDGTSGRRTVLLAY
eukprot:752712-Hanusia_phi.AAC.1